MGQSGPIGQTSVLDSAGMRGVIEATSLPTETGATVWITFDGNRRVRVPVELLRRREDGIYYLPLSLRELQSGAVSLGAPEVTVLPVVEEQVEVAKRTTPTGQVRVVKQVQETQETVDLPLVQERVQVERVPVQRYLEQPAELRYEGDTLVIPVMEEVLIVEKRLLLREEVRVTTVRQATVHQETVTLRKERVSVTRAEYASQGPGSHLPSNLDTRLERQEADKLGDIASS